MIHLDTVPADLTASPPPVPQFPKHCRTCGRVHDAEGFAALPAHPPQVDEVWKLDLRDCPCGSTLAVVAEVYDPQALAAEEDAG